MSTQAGVFVLQGDQSLVPMQPAQFASENDFQDLLARFPALLVGDQIDPENPRRWVLVKREQVVGLDQADGARWSIDHVFLDQDGIPTLVEIKRQTDSRIRREVVGQMLDYAANYAAFWPIGTLRSSFEQTCATAGRQSDDVLAELVGADFEADVFWMQVEKNLVSGKIRLLFVADVIPIELRRIVEFLNRQMTPAEVLAVELRQFEGHGLKTIVPTVLGQIEAKAAQRTNTTSGAAWDERRLFEQIDRDLSDHEAQSARKIFRTMSECSDHLSYGNDAKNGSVAGVWVIKGMNVTPARLYANEKLELYAGAMKNWPILTTIEERRRFADKFGSVAGTKVTIHDPNRYPKISLSSIAADPTVIARCVRRFGGSRESFEPRLSLTMIDMAGLLEPGHFPSHSAAGT